MSETFTPFVTQSFTWVLPGVLTVFRPKRKIAPRDLARGDFNLPPFTASDSRHNLSLGTTVRRGAPGRVCGRALARRKIAPRNLAKGDFYFSLLTASDSRHNPSPGTAVRRGAPGRVCLWALAHRGVPGRGRLRVLTRPGKGRYCLSPFTASDSRHNLRPGTTFSREAAGRVWEGRRFG